MNVRCKFLCTRTGSWNESNGTPSFSAEFVPALNDTVDKAVYSATPSGKFVLDGLTQQGFTAGTEYFLDFTAVAAIVQPVPVSNVVAPTPQPLV